MLFNRVDAGKIRIALVVRHLGFVAFHEEGHMIRVGFSSERIVRINSVFLVREQIAGVVFHPDRIIFRMAVVSIKVADSLHSAVLYVRVAADCVRMFDCIEMIQGVFIDFSNTAFGNDLLRGELVRCQRGFHFIQDMVDRDCRNEGLRLILW